MLIPPFQPKLPEIAACDQTPVVRSLLQVIADLQAQVQRLEDEIRRLQGGPPRPQLKPNTLEPAGPVAAADGDPPRRRGRRRGTPRTRRRRPAPTSTQAPAAPGHETGEDRDASGS